MINHHGNVEESYTRTSIKAKDHFNGIASYNPYMLLGKEDKEKGDDEKQESDSLSPSNEDTKIEEQEDQEGNHNLKEVNKQKTRGLAKVPKAHTNIRREHSEKAI